MTKIAGPFATHAEALAFIQGVEWMNDSSLTIDGDPRLLPEGWFVHVFDGDATPRRPREPFRLFRFTPSHI